MRAAAFVDRRCAAPPALKQSTNSRRQRHLGTYDREADAPLRSEIAQALHLGFADRHALGLPGNARIPGCAVDFPDLRRTRQRVDNGVFAAAGTYYQNFHKQNT